MSRPAQGYRYVLVAGVGWVFQADADGQTLPDGFGCLWDVRVRCDMGVGRRSARGDLVSRIAVIRMLGMIARVCFGVGATNANLPFRLRGADSLLENLIFVPEGLTLPT